MPQIDAPTVAEHRAQQREALLGRGRADPAPCPGRWSRLHDAYRFAGGPGDEATFTIAAGQTATVTATSR